MSLRATIEKEWIEALEADPSVQMAGRIGRMFRLDPVVILSDGGDPLLNRVRLAAANVVARDEKEQAEKDKAANRSRGGGAGRRPARRGKRR